MGITIVILVKIVAVALAALFWNGRNLELLLLGLIAAFAFAAQAALRRLGRSTRMLSQIIGTVGLTITAPAAYYVVTGELNSQAWTLWMANFLFATNQIHFVQLRIHSVRLRGWKQKFQHGCWFLVGEAALVVALVLAWRFHVVPWLAVLAFLPLLIRGTAWFFERQQALLVRRLGWTELAYAVIFGVCLIAGFHIGY